MLDFLLNSENDRNSFLLVDCSSAFGSADLQHVQSQAKFFCKEFTIHIVIVASLSLFLCQIDECDKLASINRT